MVVSSWKNDILKKFHEGKLAHAFLLETNDIEKCYLQILDIVKHINCPKEFNDECKEECNICNLIVHDNLPSLITINPEGQFIKNEAILSMMNKFSTVPVFTKYNIYIINEAHRLNNSSANSLLKFLEEPNDNILGFFITTNRENVISTIRSRCQIFSCMFDTKIEDNLDENFLIDVKLYLNSIFKSKDDLLYNKTHMSGYYSERIEWENFFMTMFYYIRDCYISDRKDKIDLVKYTSKNNLINMVSLIEEIIKRIKSNGNIDLILDKFVIEMRKYYE